MVVTSGPVDKINTVMAVRRLTSSRSSCAPSTKEKQSIRTDHNDGIIHVCEAVFGKQQFFCVHNRGRE